jgi:hypothetical protein
VTSGQTSGGTSGSTSGSTGVTSGQTSGGTSGQTSGGTTGVPAPNPIVAFFAAIWQATSSFVGGLITAFLGLFFGFRPGGGWWT